MFNDLIYDSLEQIRVGGWVMYPLIITCLWMWYLIIKKTIDLRRYTRRWRAVQECINNTGYADFHCVVWQKKIVDGFMKEKTNRADLNTEILDNIMTGQVPFIQKDNGLISLLSTAAPILGLLGTVSGMITTFNVISQFGTGNARALAGGISEALLTTQAGLVIAVPGLFLCTFLGRRANDLLQRMKRFCLMISQSTLINN
ncbi:MAG: MotA/TolQ/ExbB proton channel family protein [Deltaproteobacteria bacterium]|nr:MotA/TolQ/ExbB proton channel family protein [Deltaproteobacteria bacterium]